MTPLAGMLVAAALVVLAGGPGRSVGRLVRAPASRERGTREHADEPIRHEALELLTTAVAQALRSGATPSAAWWDAARIRSDDRGVPDATALLERVEAIREVDRRGRARASRAADRERSGRQVRAIVAGCTLAVQLGAPLAPVLESVGRSVVAAEEARAERAAALAGPRTTARILSWLPVVGFALATALGAAPHEVLLDGGLGTALIGAAGVLTLLGRRWSNALVERARAAEGDP